MQRRFVEGPVMLALDAVRAVAALVVVAGHMVQLGIYRGWWPFTEAFQHVAVVVFFVLSGLVIANATLLRPTTLRDYTIARATRIMPVALLAIGAGIAAKLLVGAAGSQAVPQPALMDTLSAPAAVLPALFLSESWNGTGPAWNAPYWSLCYEAWFYALFGAATYLRGWQRWLALVLGGALAGPQILLLAPVWLAGVALARSRRVPDLPPAVGAICIAFAAALIASLAELSMPLKGAVAALLSLDQAALRFSQFFVTDWLMAPLVVLLFIGLKPLAESFAAPLKRCRRPIMAAAGSSFSLYALHWPVLSLLAGFGIAVTSPLGWVAAVVALQAGAIGAARVTEAQRYALRALLTRTARGPVRSLRT